MTAAPTAPASPTATSTAIQIAGIQKAFGKTLAVAGVDLNIAPGELFFLLGPSGCGKTTLLRMIAGFVDPTAGSIRFGDTDVTHTPPNKRDAGMVFQGYALWPHMTVRQNVRFGLEVRKVPKDQADGRVDEALAKVQLSQLAERKINQLSGGQQQRVALARALVVRPRVLLLDEPLSNLDAKLRLEMRQSIREICKASGITGVYVTHDQQEALSMADRLAVMREGLAVQIGSPREVYRRPLNRFVAGFLGETNFIPAEVKGHENRGDQEFLVLESALGTLLAPAPEGETPAKGNVTCSIRPESVRLTQPGPDHPASLNRFTLTHGPSVYLGAMAQHTLRLGDALSLAVSEINPPVDARPEGSDVQIAIDPTDIVILQD